MHDISYSKKEEKVSLINTYPIENGPKEEIHGLNVITTCVFIVGVIAGSGFLTLPKAIDGAGWIGFLLMFVCCALSAYTGNILGKCWTMVRDTHPEYRTGSVRYPYPAIGSVAYGKVGRYVVSISINITMFGSTVVYILLAAENTQTLMTSLVGNNTQCYIVLIVGAVMTPFTWLGTPKDFWGVAALATLATATASVILFISVLFYGSERHNTPVTHSDVTMTSFFTAYGIICIAFNGHSAFPTFQADMKEPKDFGKALLLGYLIVLCMYTPSAVAGYAVYGEEVKDNILQTLPVGVTTTIVSILMTSHLLFGIVIILNPVSQEIEHWFNIPEHFTWKRLVSRTLMMVVVLFVAESVPHFSSILALVGGSTISILAFICPPLFYMKLCWEDPSQTPLPLHTRIFLYEIVFIGVTAGSVATYSAIEDLIANKFTVPCYVDPIKAVSG